MDGIIRRVSAFALAMMMAAPAALAEAEPTPSTEPTHTYTMMGLDMESGRDWNTHAFFTYMRERTGIAFEFRQYNNEAAYQTAKDTAFASGDLPDVFFKGAFTPEEELRYRASGQLIDLAPLIPEAAPTLSGILEARADWREAIAHPDGSIAALPSLNGYERQAYIWINQTWLTSLNLPAPITFDEFADTLRAFRSGDPNANNRGDELPLSIVGSWEAKFFLHAFGLVPNDYNIYVDESGKALFAPYEEGYRRFVEAMRALMNEGLLDSSSFRQGQSQRTTLLSEAKVNTMGSFVSVAPYTLVSAELAEAYSILPPLKANDDSDAKYRRLLSGIGRGAFAITSRCDDPAALLNWVDYLYTDEGGRLATAGILDVDYKWLDGGVWQWITDDFNPIDTVLRDRVIRTDYITPGLTPAAFERSTDLALEVRVRREGDAIQPSLTTPFPFTWPTDATREDEIAAIQLKLGAAVDEGIARFIDGEIELDDAN